MTLCTSTKSLNRFLREDPGRTFSHVRNSSDYAYRTLDLDRISTLVETAGLRDVFVERGSGGGGGEFLFPIDTQVTTSSVILKGRAKDLERYCNYLTLIQGHTIPVPYGQSKSHNVTIVRRCSECRSRTVSPRSYFTYTQTTV